ncbi:unnamed protein product, partial [Amoebophrya sp. A120]
EGLQPLSRAAGRPRCLIDPSSERPPATGPRTQRTDTATTRRLFGMCTAGASFRGRWRPLAGVPRPVRSQFCLAVAACLYCIRSLLPLRMARRARAVHAASRRSPRQASAAACAP